MKKRIKTNIYLYVLLIMFICLFFFSVFLAPSDINFDYYFHYNRILYLAENIKNGCIKPYIYFPQIQSYGYATPLFYCDVFLYPFALLIISGLNDNIVMKLFTITPVFVLLITSYYSSSRIFIKKKSVFIFCIVNCFSVYCFCNVFSRAAFGEALGTSFLPLVALGFYSITFDDGQYWLLLPIGLSCCVLSHILTTFITVIVLAILFIISIKKYINDRKRLKKLICSVFVFFALTAFFIFPMIEQFFSIKFLFSTGASSTAYGTLKENSIPLIELLDPFVDIYYNNLTNKHIPGGVGILPIILMILGIIYLKDNKEYWKIFGLGLFFLLAISNIFPWDLVQNIFGIIQYPFRLYTYVNIFFAFASSYLVEKIKNNNKIITIIYLSTMICLAFYSAGYYKKMIVEINNEEELVLNNEIHIGTGEYLPAIYDENNQLIGYVDYINKLLERDTVVSNNLSNNDMMIVNNYSKTIINFKNNSFINTYIDIPRIYYKGYEATDKLTGERLKVSQSDIGLVRVNIEKENSSFEVAYTGTLIQKISLGISAISLLAIVLFYIRSIKRARL